MSFIEFFKIIGLIIILILAGVVLKLLSDFEYEMRKDRIQYETLWKQDFEDRALDSLWSTNDGDLSIALNDGTLNLTPGQTNDNLQFKPPFPSDSMYLTIRLKWPDSDIVQANIDLVRTGGNSIPLFANSTADDQFVMLTSDIIKCEDCHHLQFIMNRKNPSILNPIEPQWQIDYITLSAIVNQEKLF